MAVTHRSGSAGDSYNFGVPSWTCPNCGGYRNAYTSHFCDAWQDKQPGCRPLPIGKTEFTPVPLTEEDIRRIIREELASFKPKWTGGPL